MKKRLWKNFAVILLAVLVTAILAACGSESTGQKPQDTESDIKQESPFNTVVREEWDIYAALNCFVKTEFNPKNNPVRRELYSAETFEKGFEMRYEYDISGNLVDLRLDAKAASSLTHRDARFELSFDKESMKTEAKPLFDNDYELSFSWDEKGRLSSEEWKSSAIDVSFVYDKTGSVTREKSADLAAVLTHRYSNDKSSILITEAGSLTEMLTLTFGDSGMPASVTTPEYKMNYTYNEKKLCTLIETQVAGQTFGKTVISYDKKGNPVKCEVKVIAVGTETVAARYEYTYDENGNLTRETLLTANTKLELKITSDRAYEYDAKGRLIKETEGIYPTLGKLTDNRITEYEYDEKGNKIQLTQIVCIPSGKVIKDKAVARYTAEGKLASYTDYEYHTNGTLAKTVENEYDGDKKVVKTTALSYYIGQKTDGVLVDGQLHTKAVTELKPDGKKIKETAEQYTQVGWRELFLERLYYENGKMMSEVSEECREKGASTTKIIANYHENGKLSKTEKRYIESSGKLSRVIFCTYDENGKLLTEDDKRYP
ncbi:MAG: RHS repeat protein [Clostridia bacterium]|nr:RHS repeat protein [Clostridia bacterium]